MSTPDKTRPAPSLGLTPEEIAVRYSALQAKLVPPWKSLTTLSERGRLGLTAVGESQAEADEIYQRAVEVLDQDAEAAMRQDPLPAP